MEEFRLDPLQDVQPTIKLHGSKFSAMLVPFSSSIAESSSVFFSWSSRNRTSSAFVSTIRDNVFSLFIVSLKSLLNFGQLSLINGPKEYQFSFLTKHGLGPTDDVDCSGRS
jgi:hypothetical protein